MTRRTLVVLGTVACVTAGLVVWVLSNRREPRYQTKSLSEWLKVYEQAADNTRREEAADAIRHMGTKALPFLMRHVRYGVPDNQMKLSIVMQRLPRPIRNWWLGSLVKHNTASEAALGLAILGPLAKPVIPELVAGLGNPNSENG